MQDLIQAELQEFFGNDFSIHSKRTLSGGCINDIYHLQTSDGEFCIKINDSSLYPGMFDEEVRGIQLLQKNSNFTLPEVFQWGKTESFSFLLLKYIKSAAPTSDFWEVFGRRLAELHQATSDTFGLDQDNYIGSLTQKNTRSESWTSFFIEQRIEPQLKLAHESGLMSMSSISKFNRLFAKLDKLFPDEPPALLHGDLWSGNYLVDQAGLPAIIDPAVYYGNREMDLAMTFLFGGFDNRMYDAYNEEFALEPNYRDRIELWTIYPLLVHVNLFGGVYIQQVDGVVGKYI